VAPKPRILATCPLVGLWARVVDSANKHHVSLSGQIIDETHGTVTLFDGTHRRVVPKDTTVFEVALPTGEKVLVEGKAVVGHPAERLRRAKRRRW